MNKAILFCLLFLNSGLSAQINFSGMWILKNKEHINGPEYSNELPSQIVVTQTKDSLILEITNFAADSLVTKLRQTIAMNGKASTSTSATSKRKLVRSLTWSGVTSNSLKSRVDKSQTLTITTIFYIPLSENEIDFTRVENWTIVNGQLHVYKKSIETQNESWAVKGIFKKQ